jgi:hypothetical protein
MLRRNIPEDEIFHSHLRENLKTNMIRRNLNRRQDGEKFSKLWLFYGPWLN